MTGTLSSVRMWYASGKEDGGENEFFRFEAADGLDSWGKDRVDPVIAEICLSFHVVGNKNEF